MSPAETRISDSTPVVVDGTSIDTLSVSISNRLSPGLTASPAALNHFVILPSATVSPSCGIKRSMNACSSGASFDPFPSDFHRRIGWAQNEAVADEFVTAHQIPRIARLDAVEAMMRHGSGFGVDRIGAEIGNEI